jgi:hypothetical protein
MQQFKIDLHTHSILSHDGGITTSGYEDALKSGLDFIAVTDHNEIDFALELHRKLGNKIIVGEEIKSIQGEVIGLFLSEKIPAKLSLAETVAAVKSQNGLVYIPHPFDIRRSALSEKSVLEILAQIDLLEIFNARSITPLLNSRVSAFARKHKITGGLGSDSHFRAELCRSYAGISDVPDRDNLVSLMQTATFRKRYVLPWHFLSPKINKFRKHLTAK